MSATLSSSSSSKDPLQSALTSWSTFNLTSRRPHLDNAAQSLLDAKETSLKARKLLGDQTKSLKRAVKSAESDGSKDQVSSLAKECKATIKSYQEDIDSLTRRCKVAETSFVQLYHSLYECVDPALVLEEAIRQLDGRDGQVNNLVKGMEELNGELESVREEKMGMELELEDKVIELKEVKEELKDSVNGGGSGNGSGDAGVSGGGGAGGALSLAEREELIRLRSEVAEYEVEFRGLKNQDITIRKLESE